MDYKKIKLDNERNGHVVKRVNNLKAWGFFKVLYRDSIWRLFGFNLVMLLIMAPTIYMFISAALKVSTLAGELPVFNGFSPFAVGVLPTVSTELATETSAIYSQYGLYMALFGLLFAVMFSGGFAVIRDAFWTGKLCSRMRSADGITLKTNVTLSMWSGLKSAFPYGLVTAGAIGFSVFGICKFYAFFVAISKAWAIVLTILICLVALVVATFFLILCSVATTYKQSVAQNVADSWRLLWLNILPNVMHVVFAVVPLFVYLIVANSQLLLSIYFVFMFMFGGFYFPHVWQTHMMRTFALFHPVEVKKQKQANEKPATAETAAAN